jgi:ParB family chromosome partitioning protein
MGDSALAVRDDHADEPGMGRPLPVRLSRIERYENQPRRYFDQRGLEELADSMQERGQETPVKVCRHSAKPGAFVLIGGERRWRAFAIIRDRTGKDPLVDCFIDTVRDERHHFRKAFLDNLQREDLQPVDEAAAYLRLFIEIPGLDGAGPSRSGKVAEIAALAKKSVTHVENYLAIAALPDAVKRLMDPLRPREERLLVSAAVDIARSVSDPALQLTIAREAIERNLGTVEVRTMISVRTGRSGYGIGGRMRRPSDDYKAFKVFLSSTVARARRIKSGMDISALYSERDDDVGDRRRDGALVRELIGHLNGLLVDVEGDGP